MNIYDGPDSLSGLMREEYCPACGHHIAVSFLEPTMQPLATVAWPESSCEAESMVKLPLDFVRCVMCGHVYNAAFDYAKVPYTRKPNLMFNRGINWSRNMEIIREKIIEQLPRNPVVVEIGHGSGGFLRALAEKGPPGKYVGFDPNGAVCGKEVGIDFRNSLFEPKIHMREFFPHLIVSRHVLEHLSHPMRFVQSLSFAAAWLDVSPILYLEVPCIDRAIETGRTVDFYYEHNSQFTTESFARMLEMSGGKIIDMGHFYDREVIYGFVKLGEVKEHVRMARKALSFRDRIKASSPAILHFLDTLFMDNKKVAVWGGTGKSAAFINRFKMDAKRFPIVVDSDPEKVGTFVPGTGQEIREPSWLIKHPVDAVIVPPQWRVKDILSEMIRLGISVDHVYIENDGFLVNYLDGDHPYSWEEKSSGYGK